MKTRRQYHQDAELSLECAEGLYREAEEQNTLPNFDDANYWVARAQVSATLALTAEY